MNLTWHVKDIEKRHTRNSYFSNTNSSTIHHAINIVYNQCQHNMSCKYNETPKPSYINSISTKYKSRLLNTKWSRFTIDVKMTWFVHKTKHISIPNIHIYNSCQNNTTCIHHHWYKPPNTIIMISIYNPRRNNITCIHDTVYFDTNTIHHSKSNPHYNKNYNAYRNITTYINHHQYKPLSTVPHNYTPTTI